jgi:hypothetical protein
MATRLIPLTDLFHIVLNYNKQIYEKYRRFWFKFMFPRVFKKGRALPKRKLVTIKFLLLLLRTATTPEVETVVREWFKESLISATAPPAYAEDAPPADPRAMALYALLFFHAPLVALLERTAMHGPMKEMQEIAPLVALVRFARRRDE